MIAKIVQLKDRPSVRLIPAAVLEPRLRLVEGGEIIEGPAFDLEAIMAEHQVPLTPVRASPAMRDRILTSFDFSSLRSNRFNGVGDPGVYYAGTTLPAAIEEIRYHLENDPGIPFDSTRVYRVVTARVDGRFLDLRDSGAKALNPDVSVGYPAGRKLALQARASMDGIIYPSARHPDGTCLAIFNPEAINDIRLDRLISFEPIADHRYGYRLHVQPHQLAEVERRREFA